MDELQKAQARLVNAQAEEIERSLVAREALQVAQARLLNAQAMEIENRDREVLRKVSA